MSHDLTRKEFVQTGAVAAGAAAAVAAFGFTRPASAAELEGAIIQLARLNINLEKEAEAVEAITALCKGVEENEPGVLAYVAHREAEDPSKLVFYEVYKDQAALTAHGGTPHMAGMRTAFGAGVLSGPLQIIKLNRTAGFLR